MGLKLLSSVKSFGGQQRRYEVDSVQCGCKMTVSVFLPPQAVESVPVLFYLSGLTCTDLNAVEKSGAQRTAASLGLALVFPDTSPRSLGVPGEAESWDFGVGAGFYLDATQPPWLQWRMESHVCFELPELLSAELPCLDMNRKGITGHSMGGHGALTLALRHTSLFRSVSAFAPIANPSRVPWGQKAFQNYLGPDAEDWKAHDSCELIRRYDGPPRNILVHVGTADSFLSTQLQPEKLREAASETAGRIIVDLHMADGYDHSYYFVSSFIQEHLEHHAAVLLAAAA